MRLITILILLNFFTSCDFESEFDLGQGYYLFGDNANTAIVKKNNLGPGSFDALIFGEIVDYSFNKDFILVFRNASEEAKPYFDTDSLWEFQKGKYPRQYWIIEKRNNIIHGPLELFEYKKLKIELNIIDLKLEKME